MDKESPERGKTVALNRKASHEYFILDRRECGIELRGSEVKSIRAGQISLVGGYADVEGREAVLRGVNIAPYEKASHFNHEPTRPRRLLLHKREIIRLGAHMQLKGHALIPLAVYFKRGMVKVELGVCKGKRQSDKRERLAQKTAEREIARQMRAEQRH